MSDRDAGGDAGPTVELVRRGPTVELVLSNPAKLNALTGRMLDALDAHLDAIERDPSVRCALVIGAGDGPFSVGADVAEWGALGPGRFAREWVRRGHRTFDRLAQLSVPSVAVLHGHAFGGGLELAACCDVRTMAPSATLALPEARVGVVPGWSGTQRLARLLPAPVVREMALFGRRVDARRALALGFVAEVADDPLEAARRMAAGLETLSPASLEIAKCQLGAAAGEAAPAMVEALGSGWAGAGADRAEGVAAFREKRAPAFGDGLG